MWNDAVICIVAGLSWPGHRAITVMSTPVMSAGVKIGHQLGDSGQIPIGVGHLGMSGGIRHVQQMRHRITTHLAESSKGAPVQSLPAGLTQCRAILRQLNLLKEPMWEDFLADAIA